MKTKILSILALLLMTVTQGAWADELTVYDGAAFCPYSPAYMNSFDWYTRSQYIIPAANLEAMNGKIITALKYYSNTSNKTSTCNVDVYLKEVGYTTFNSTPTFETKSGIVYRGTVSIAGDGTLTITFTTPYTYNGGNLLIGMENTETDNLKYTSFSCQYVTGAVAFGSNSSSLAAVTATRGEFIPKTTFTYETPDPNAGLLTGRFSVSATKQVRFSQGNLQAYFASAGTSCTWRFATNQYDYVGSAAANVSINGNGSVSAAGAVDLFGWVGNSSTVLTGTPAKYGISNSTTASDYGTSTSDALKDDWGNLTITANGSATNLGWRTLTSAEWVYLFNTRTSGSTVNGTSNARFTHATINTDGTSVNGVILFPDGVTIANGEATSWGNVNSNSTWSGSTKCTSAQWTALAAKGCVFLPAAGRRRGATVYGLPSSEANVPFGYYWSSSPNASDQTKADHMYFYSDRVYPGNTGLRYDCMSVRLVKNYIFTGLGTQASPYLIASTTDWNNLVSAVNAGETYSGNYFKMTANVGTVSTWMTGTFSGTFDGDGKTLTVGYSNTTADVKCAPFGTLNGATIQNLKVAGSISSNQRFIAGIAAWCSSTGNNVTNCLVSATINSGFSGNAADGGLVSLVDDGASLNVTGCAFAGKMLTTNGTTSCGGIVGWRRSSGTVTITNCLYAPTSATGSETWIASADGENGNANFCRWNTSEPTITNCYYTTDFGSGSYTAQGIQARTIAKGDYVSSLSVTKGDGTEYDVSGITVYSGGIDFNDGSTTTFYGGSGQSVSLALTAETRTGYHFKQYAASQGTLSGETTNTPTLTMPAANSTANDAVTISAEYDPFSGGTGTSVDPYQIASTADWNLLVSNVNAGETYSGTYFKMTANVGTVSTWMTGTFSGTFDGDGNTLTVTYSQSGGDYCAPFGYMSGATVENLKVAGTIISSSGYRQASIGGRVANSTIRKCTSSVAFTLSQGDWVECGGLVAHLVDNTTLTMTGCAFTGSITYSNATGYAGGGLIGWLSNGCTGTLTDCVFNPSSVSFAKESGLRFYMFANPPSGDYTLNLTRCYYNGTAACNEKITKQDGTMQMRTIAAGDYVSALSVTKGDATATYAVSGITVYSGGIDFNDGSTTTFYGGSGQTVSLALTAETRTGYHFKQYAASQGTLSGQTTNTPTLTMPAASGETLYTTYTATAGTTGIHGETDDYTKLVDNIKTVDANKWMGTFTPGVYAEFNTPNAIVPTGYVITTAGDAASDAWDARSPKTWKLYGKLHEGDSWTMLDDVTNGNLPKANFTDVSYSIANTSAYKYFRYEISAIKGSTELFQLAELQLKGYDAVTISAEYDPFSGGTGTSVNPYQIASTADWNLLVSNVNGGETYSGNYFKMTANVGTVSTWMTGTFSGTFDGDGNTLTVDYSATTEKCAPFGTLGGASIQKLKVAGTITTNQKYAAGIAAYTTGTTYITNCLSSVAISSAVSGDGTHGGLVAVVDGDASLSMTGCAFTGKLLTTNSTTSCGGFVGFRWYTGTLTMTDCLYAPASATGSETWISDGEGQLGNANFSRWSNSTPTFTRCYYTTDFGSGNFTAQGIQAHTIAAGDYVTVANAGAVSNNYDVSGLTFYDTPGFRCGDALYASNADAVSLTLTAPEHAGYGLVYSADNGTVTGDSNPYTLTMVDANAIINVKYSASKAINKYTSDDTSDGWYLIASPVVSMTPTADNGFLTNIYDLYYFDQTQENEWVNFKDNETHTNIDPGFELVSGKGYLYANSADVTLQFAGTPYAGDGKVALTYDADAPHFAGWNLVGNPFATAATVDKSYYRMNEDRNEIVTGTGSINPMEGIFVQATEDGQYVTFHQPDHNAAPTSNPLVVMNLTQNRGNVIDRAIVRFGNDNKLPKFQLFENSTKLAIAQEGKEYAIVNAEAAGEMPVNFKANENGQYTLTVNAEDVEMNYLHLIDNITGADIDLLQNPSYTFNASNRDYESRFRLVFVANENDNENENQSFAFCSNGNWIIVNEGRATLQVIDVTGRILSSETINGSVSKSINQPAGVYMLRLINGDDVKVQKIVVK